MHRFGEVLHPATVVVVAVVVVVGHPSRRTGDTSTNNSTDSMEDSNLLHLSPALPQIAW